MFETFTIKEELIFNNGEVITSFKKTNMFFYTLQVVLDIATTSLLGYYVFNMHFGNLIWK